MNKLTLISESADAEKWNCSCYIINIVRSLSRLCDSQCSKPYGLYNVYGVATDVSDELEVLLRATEAKKIHALLVHIIFNS